MSLPPDSLPDHMDGVPSVPAASGEGFGGPMDAMATPEEKRFPAWSGWDVLAIAVFSIFCLLLFLILAPFVSGAFNNIRQVTMATMMSDARLIRAFLVAQVAAYLVIAAGMFLIVRSRASSRFGEAIEWNWPSASAPIFFASGIVLALVID